MARFYRRGIRVRVVTLVQRYRGGCAKGTLKLMAQETLVLIAFAVLGLYSTRLLSRLAHVGNELPLKSLVATLLAAGIVIASFTGTAVPRAATAASLLLALAFIVGPLALVALARAQRYTLAGAAANLLYWTEEGQAATRRLLAQVALHQGHAGGAMALLGDRAEDNLLKAQAHALEQRWDEVLALELPEEGDMAFPAMAARANALMETGDLTAAQRELERIESLWHESGQQPLGYQATILTRARLCAARGDFDGARRQLEEPLPNVPPYQIVAILARAAETAGRHDTARQFYQQAYTLAPEGPRDRFGGKLKAYGEPLPEVARTEYRSLATLLLVGAIALAYGAQLYIDQLFGVQYRLNASSAVAAFLLNIPGVPEGETWWRFLSYALVHGNLIHIGFNSWVLYDIGRIFESRRNWGNLVAAFVVGTGMGAYFTTMAQGADTVVLVGASGGVLGVVGALLADAWRSGSPGDRMLTRALFQWIVLIMLISLLPGISLWGHVGGLIGGLLWGFVRQGLPASGAFDRAVGVAGAAALALAAVMAGQWLVTHLL